MRLLAPVLLACAAAPAAQETKKHLTIDKLLDFESVSSPRLSPDSQQVVYTRGWVDKVNDRRRSELWIMSATGENKRFLVKGSSPRWSPDGKRIAFLAAGEPSGNQIHVLFMADRSVTQITHVEQSPSSIRWSPDGETIAFSMQVPEKKKFSIKLPKRPRGAKWAAEPKIITRLNYRRDRRGYRASGFRHVFVVDATGGTPRQVTSGDFDHGSPRWHPNGEELWFSANRVKDADWQIRESDIYRVDVASGKITQVTKRPGSDSGPVISPDGKLVAYRMSPKNRDTYNVSSIRIQNIGGSRFGDRTIHLDRQPSSMTWSADSEKLYATFRDHGQSHLFEFPMSGEQRQLTKGEIQFRLEDVSKHGVILGSITSPQQPRDLWAIDASGKFHQLTRVNDDVLAGVQLGEVEEFNWKSVDDFDVQGWLVKPPDFDPKKKYPLILQIHGGPHGMYGIDFSFERQNHAANGYLVLYTNPRGSVGYGKKFGNAINNAYPGRDYDDLMKGVDAVIAKGYVDEKNLFVYGGSGGGVLTCWIVGHTDRFAGAVSMFPVTNWISFVGTTDGPYWYTNFKKLPWEDIDEHWRRSPLKYVGNVTTPTMLITGELDLRTPMAQTEEFYQALKLRKVDTMMIRVPNEYHGAAGRHVSNQLRRILYVRKWFERYRTKPKAIEASDKK